MSDQTVDDAGIKKNLVIRWVWILQSTHHCPRGIDHPPPHHAGFRGVYLVFQTAYPGEATSMAIVLFVVVRAIWIMDTSLVVCHHVDRFEKNLL